MNRKMVAYFVGSVLRIEAMLMLVPTAVSLIYRENEWIYLFAATALSYVAGYLLSFRKPKNMTFYMREGITSVALGWILMSVFGAIPLWHGVPHIGFTDVNVREVLDKAGIPEKYGIVSEWYDGYLFGREKMYCPWDVLLYVKSVLKGTYSEVNGPESYWVNTSETSLNIIHGFLGKTRDINESFEQLLAGNSIECVVKDNIPYHKIHESGDNIWSALLETGYLTKAVTEKMQRMPLKIPNREIQAVFRQEVWEYFKDKVDNTFVGDFVNALWAEESKNAETALNQILEATLSFYHEYHEYSYHLLLDGFFTGKGYLVQSERESGYGRSDLFILDPVRMRCLLIELKHVQKETEMDAAVKEASSQIAEQKYESVLRYEGYITRLKYSIVFCNKKCLIKMAN